MSTLHAKTEKKYLVLEIWISIVCIVNANVWNEPRQQDDAVTDESNFSILRYTVCRLSALVIEAKTYETRQ